QMLEAARYGRDLFLTAVAAIVRFDKLQVIDKNRSNFVSQFQAPRVGGNSKHVERGGVVDVEFRPATLLRSFKDALHVFAVQMALAKLVAVDARLAAEQTLSELNTGLLEAYEENGLIVFDH